jgi:hypothetical protein
LNRSPNTMIVSKATDPQIKAFLVKALTFWV